MEFKATIKLMGYDKLKDVQVTLENNLKTIDKANKNYTIMSNKLKLVNDEIKKIDKQKNAFNQLFAGTPLTMLGDIDKKIKTIGTALGDIGEKGKSGFNAIYSASKIMFSGMITGFLNIIKIAWSFAGPVALIVAAVAIIKRVWEMNIGGMQTQIYKLIGYLRNIGAIFSFAFGRALQNLAPIFKILVNIVGVVASAIGYIDRIKGLGKAFEYILTAATSLYLSLAIYKGILLSLTLVSKAYAIVQGGIAVAMKLATVATWLFNAALYANPIVWIVAAVAGLIIGLTFLYKWLDKLSTQGSKTATFFKYMLIAIFPVVGIVIKLIDGFKALYNAWEKWHNRNEKENQQMFAGQNSMSPFIDRNIATKNSTTANTTQNNQQYNIHTSAPITEKTAVGILNSLSFSLSQQSKVGA